MAIETGKKWNNNHTYQTDIKRCVDNKGKPTGLDYYYKGQDGKKTWTLPVHPNYDSKCKYSDRLDYGKKYKIDYICTTTMNTMGGTAPGQDPVSGSANNSVHHLVHIKGKGWSCVKNWEHDADLYKSASKANWSTEKPPAKKKTTSSSHSKSKNDKSKYSGAAFEEQKITDDEADANRIERIQAAVNELSKTGSSVEAKINSFKSRYMITYKNKLRGYGSFNRYQYQNQFNLINGTREYIFFTKPKLNIIKNKGKGTLVTALKGDPFWEEMLGHYKRIIGYLCGRKVGNLMDKWNPEYPNTDYRHVFIPLLTNMVASSLDMPSKSAETTETGANIYGTTIQYRKGSLKSDEGYDFSLEFYDDRWLDVYYFFKMWDEYESLKDIGMISPPGTNNCNPYRVFKRLHDQISIYKFIVDADDMSTILYYAKFTGCFPKSVPREAFSEIKKGLITYSVDWHAQFIDDMNPIILHEFNALCEEYMKAASLKAPSGSSWGNYAGNVNHNNNARFEDSGFVKCPYIVRLTELQGDSGPQNSYRLIWLDNNKQPNK